jgi:hypothetical protein
MAPVPAPSAAGNRTVSTLPAEAPALFTIRPRDDLGAMDPSLGREHLTLAQVEAWMDEHEDQGTFEVIDERDGLPACCYELGLAGGGYACDCGRPTCPDTRAAAARPSAIVYIKLEIDGDPTDASAIVDAVLEMGVLQEAINGPGDGAAGPLLVRSALVMGERALREELWAAGRGA